MRPKPPFHFRVKCSLIEWKAPHLHGLGQAKTGLISKAIYLPGIQNISQIISVAHMVIVLLLVKCEEPFTVVLLQSSSTQYASLICVAAEIGPHSGMVSPDVFPRVCFLAGLFRNIRQQEKCFEWFDGSCRIQH